MNWGTETMAKSKYRTDQVKNALVLVIQDQNSSISYQKKSGKKPDQISLRQNSSHGFGRTSPQYNFRRLDDFYVTLLFESFNTSALCYFWGDSKYTIQYNTIQSKAYHRPMIVNTVEPKLFSPKWLWKAPKLRDWNHQCGGGSRPGSFCHQLYQ